MIPMCECGYWANDGTESGYCRYQGCTCSKYDSGYCPLDPVEDEDEELDYYEYVRLSGSEAK